MTYSSRFDHLFRTAASVGLAGVLSLGAAVAEVPALLSVQGRLETAGGAPVTTPSTLTLGVHEAETGGVPFHLEVDVVVPDDDGAFVTTLGDGPALDPARFDQPLWVSIQREGAATMTPRIPLLPAPYAIRAREADVAVDLAPLADLDLGGFRIGGVASPVSSSDVANQGYVDAGDAAVLASVTALAAATAAHAADADIHFTQAEISILASQVSGLDSAISTSTHAGRTDNPHQVAAGQVAFAGGGSSLVSTSAEAAAWELDGRVGGSLAGLQTTTQESLVAALNELVGRVDALEAAGDPPFPPTIPLAAGAYGLFPEGFAVDPSALHFGEGTPTAFSGGVDVSGDGVPDVAGRYIHHTTLPKSQAIVLFGGDPGLAHEVDLATHVTTGTGVILESEFVSGTPHRVALVEDVTGDGVGDILIGTQGGGQPSYFGTVFLIPGGAGLKDEPDLDSLWQSQTGTGTVFVGNGGMGIPAFEYDYGHHRAGVGSAGDVDGDGLNDFLIGTYYSGTFLVKGRSTPWPTLVSTASMAAGDGTTATLVNCASQSMAYEAPTGVGDIDDDGIDDFTPGLILFGDLPVVYGDSAGFGGSLDICPLTTGGATWGTIFRDGVHGDVVNAFPAGDVNGDGIDDVAFATSTTNPASRTYVLFGKSGGFPPSVSLSDLATGDGSEGFVLEMVQQEPARVGVVPGDVNGDGFDDLVLGEPANGARGVNSGQGFLVYGRATFPASIDLGSIATGDGTTGVQILPIDGGDVMGGFVSIVGDLTGDGKDELAFSTTELGTLVRSPVVLHGR